MELYRARIERLAKWARGRKDAPVTIELVPTDRCNFNCLSCWRRSWKKEDLEKRFSQELSDERLLRLVDEAAELGVMEIAFVGGGEPLMRKTSTLKVLKEIKRFGMWGLLTTNGTLLTQKDAEFLVKIGWDQVQFSLDAPTPELNDYLRGKGSFEGVVRGVKFLRKARKKFGSDKPFIGFNTVLTRLIADKVDKMIELASQVGSELVYIEPLYPGYVKERLDLNGGELKILRKNLKKACKKAKELGVATNAETFFETHLVDKRDFRKKVLDEVKDLEGFIGSPCFRPWYLMGIKASGFAGCCSTFEVGEYINRKSLKEVWFGKIFERIRRNMLKKKIPSYCSKCSVVVLTENRELRKMLMREWKKR